MELRKVVADGSVHVTMNPVLRFLGIFYSPAEVFASLTRSKWAWIAPILVVFLIGIAAYPFIKTIVAEERSQRMAASPLFERMPQEQRDEILSRTRESILNPPWWHWLIGVFAAYIPALVAAGLMLIVGNIVLGGEVKYRMMLNAYAFSSLVTVPESIIKVPLMISKQTLDIPTSLALVLPVEASGSFTYAFLDGFDIFSIWMLVLVVMGMRVMLRNMSTTKIAVPMSVLWLIWVVIKSAMSHFLGGGIGL